MCSMDDEEDEYESDDNIDITSYNEYNTSIFFEDFEEVQLNLMDQVNRQLPRSRSYQSASYRSIHGYRSSYYCFGVCSCRFSLEIHPRMMTMYSHDRIVAYAEMFRCGSQDPNVLRQLTVLQIMQKVRTTPDSYDVVIVLKTYWLRLVQRTWKRVYRERRRVVQLRCSRRCQRHVELTGRYIEGAQYLPGLCGMLYT